MKLKHILAASTALTFIAIAGASYAGNDANIIQLGNDNTGSIDQSGGESNRSLFVQDGDNNSVDVVQNGNTNTAGRNNDVTPPYSPLYGRMWQTGDSNTIEILQTGNMNGIVQHRGASSNGNPYDDGNFYQEGNFNQAFITQHGGGGQSNGIDEINQLSSDTATSLTNTLTILQDKVANGTYGANSSDYNYVWNFISTVNQNNTGGAANELTLTQIGGIHSRENKIARADQDGTGNIGGILQNGYLNYTYLTQTGDNNAANVSLVGNRNGSTGTTGGPRTLGAGSFSANAALDVAGVVQGRVIQDGDGNDLSYLATGDSNLFGFTQDGNNNTINGVVTGDANQAAAYQMGNGNTLDFAQDGGNNDLGVEMIGDSNLINARQTQTGGDTNSISVSINGSNNNNYPTSAALEGDALDAKLFASADYGSSLTQGMLVQNGTGNQTTLTVSTDLNAFATYQNGNSNTIVGLVDTGNGNQAVVAQVGNNNDANFIQSGGGNNIGIMQ